MNKINKSNVIEGPWKSKQTNGTDVGNFKIGQTVVHLSHGLGTIIGVEDRQLINDKETEKFYIVEVKDGGAPKKVFVPVNSSANRLRPVMDKKTATEVLAYITLGKPNADMDCQTWNRRYREYMERIHTGDPMQIAEVYVSLRALNAEKDLSFGERKLAEQCKELLIREFSSLGMALPE
jgi:CarD family transcriptional regulator